MLPVFLFNIAGGKPVLIVQLAILPASLKLLSHSARHMQPAARQKPTHTGITLHQSTAGVESMDDELFEER